MFHGIHIKFKRFSQRDTFRSNVTVHMVKPMNFVEESTIHYFGWGFGEKSCLIQNSQMQIEEGKPRDGSRTFLRRAMNKCMLGLAHLIQIEDCVWTPPHIST